MTNDLMMINVQYSSDAISKEWLYYNYSKEHFIQKWFVILIYNIKSCFYKLDFAKY